MPGLTLVLALVATLSAAQAPAQPPAAPATAVVTARNPLDLARASETLVVPAADIKRLLGTDDPRKVVVKDGAGRPVLSQAVDLDDDGKFDQLIFQADFQPKQAKTFTLAVAAERQVPQASDFKAYGRFVRERRDDFAWENDRIAHRMYGAALETWTQEPLTSSTVDIWSKRTRRLLINDWYMVDDYHRDHGEGADFYSAGKSRGCGGNGVWADGKLYPSANFRDSRVLANGPIRVMFELTYATWDAAGTKVSEVKRITLDAGQNLDRFESAYKVTGGAAVAAHAMGIKKAAGSVSVTNRALGILRTWEPVTGTGNGSQGCGIVVADAADVTGVTEADGNYLVTAKVPAAGPAVYYAGFGWDKSGDFAGAADWDRYLEQAARRLRAPIEVTVASR
jgi:hypothetical protein